MVPEVPCMPGIGTRCGRDRTKHNSDARGKDQNFTHHLAPFVVPPALLVAGITLPARTGFRHVPVTNERARNRLAGPRSRDMPDVAAYADAFGRLMTYVDMSFDQWRDQELGKRGLSECLFEHFLTMARLHAANRAGAQT
jgi:hypothetical protein